MQTVALLLSLAPLALALPQEDVVTGVVTDVATGVVTGPSALAPTVAAAPTAMTEDNSYAMPTSQPAMEIISALYGSSVPAAVTGAVATSLASALYSQARDWENDGKYKSLADVVYMAAATASPSVTDFGLDGLNAPFTTASWYKNGVPKSVQTEVESYYRDLAAVPQSVFSAAGVTVTSAAAPLSTSGAMASASASDNVASVASKPTPTGSTNSEDHEGSSSANSDDHENSGSVNSAPLNGPDDSGAATVTGTVLASVVAAVAMGVVAAL